jgi:hypothetical protein
MCLTGQELLLLRRLFLMLIYALGLSFTHFSHPAHMRVLKVL